jgi:hypothetical protein
MGVVDDAFKIATTGFDLKKKAVDRLRGAYVRRRAEFLHLHNSSWNANRIATQLKAELTVVQDYLAGKNPLINDTDSNPLHHGDQKVWAALTTWSVDSGAFGQRFFEGIERQDGRTERNAYRRSSGELSRFIRSSYGRASGPPPQLQQGALDKILDR